MRIKFLEVISVILAGGFLVYSGISLRGVEGAFRVEKIKMDGGSEGAVSALLGRDLRKVTTVDVMRAIGKDPFISEVEVKKIYPHTLLIKVIRKRPFACMLSGGKEYLIDRKGRVIKPGCPEDALRFIPSKLPLKFQFAFIDKHREEFSAFEWVRISSPFHVEGKLRSKSWRVLLPIEGFSEKLSLLLSLVPTLEEEGPNFSLLDFTCQGKLYLRREK